MSNYLAIATVTAAFSHLLSEAIAEAVPGANVTTQRPDSARSATPGPGVNLYLFQVVPNPALRQVDTTLVQRPQVALDLNYLLTFYGNESQGEPQRLLGSTIRILHDRPVITRDTIHSTIQKEINADADHYLGSSNLAEQMEPVRITQLVLDLEDLSKLWSVFFQIPYTLSVGYQASVVLIGGEDTPPTAPPVRSK